MRENTKEMLDDKRVVLGMSGGVDSSAAAVVLVEQGYEVIGMSLTFLGPDFDAERDNICCTPASVAEARKVCRKLSIPFYAVDVSGEFEEEIIAYFVAEYRRGRTPNPCVVCNSRMKFPHLFSQAEKVGARWIATGHYARVERDSGRFAVMKGVDREKDQSYFLFDLDGGIRSRLKMPLGGMTKNEARKLVKKRGLKTHSRPESQEVCFVPGNKYEDFLTDKGHVASRPGPIYDMAGKVIGEHRGIEFYTIGQRRGLGIGAGHPLYVLSIDAERNSLVVGRDEELLKMRLRVRNLSWQGIDSLEGERKAEIKIRYRTEAASGRIKPVDEETVEVVFDGAVRAVTPGQAAVFYDGEMILGGGWIEG